MDVAHPFHFDARGRTAAAGEAAHLRDLVEQVLFTSPGERVNRPDFGSGLMQLVFAPNSTALAATARASAQGALQRWLGDRISVEEVQVAVEDSVLRVAVRYVVLHTREARVDRFERSA